MHSILLGNAMTIAIDKQSLSGRGSLAKPYNIIRSVFFLWRLQRPKKCANSFKKIASCSALDKSLALVLLIYQFEVSKMSLSWEFDGKFLFVKITKLQPNLDGSNTESTIS